MIGNDSEKGEELLEALYVRTVEEGRFGTDGLGDPAELSELLGERVVIGDGQIRLSAGGLKEATEVVRRHRLAERLITDVFGRSDNLTHDRACRFEHIIDQGLDESICTLLGHPSICPHGKPIPQGSCCSADETEVRVLVTTLSRMLSGQKGQIAYLHSDDSAILTKLMALGVVPGISLEVIQSTPSFAFQAGESQFAVDRAIADSIHVRLESPSVNTRDRRVKGRGGSKPRRHARGIDVFHHRRY